MLIHSYTHTLIHSSCSFLQVFESKAAMDLNLETTHRYTIATAFHVERQITRYFQTLFQAGTTNSTANDENSLMTFLSVNVQVKDEGSISEGRTSLETLVTLVYLAQDARSLSDLLLARVDPAILAQQLQVPALSATYEDDADAATVNLASVPDADDGRPRADKGLITITVFLSLALLVVASVVLYVSGGFMACQRGCINCLFEEIDEEDDYAIAKKSTFQVQSFDEESGGSQEDVQVDTDSLAPSEMTQEVRKADGVLGAVAGLGIKTPQADTSGYDSSMYMDTPSAMSEVTNHENPLGITSMRKLPLGQNEVPSHEAGGLAHLILQRRAYESPKQP
jgi:hypothetical protein